MGEPQITHWDGCWKDGPRHYECAKAKLQKCGLENCMGWRSEHATNWVRAERLEAVDRELRAAREVVEAARTALWAGLHDPRMKAALAAYDAARNEQPSPENQSGSQAGSAATGTGSASTNDNEDREVKQ